MKCEWDKEFRRKKTPKPIGEIGLGVGRLIFLFDSRLEAEPRS